MHWIFKYNKLHRVAAWLLLLLMSGYLGSITLFTHTHIENGVRIVHSHPFGGTAQEHSHTAQAYDLFHLLSNYNVDLLCNIPDLSPRYDEIVWQCRLPELVGLEISYYLFSALRAPPVSRS